MGDAPALGTRLIGFGAVKNLVLDLALLPQIDHFDAGARELNGFRAGGLVACLMDVVRGWPGGAGAAAPMVCVVYAHFCGGSAEDEWFRSDGVLVDEIMRVLEEA